MDAKQDLTNSEIMESVRLRYVPQLIEEAEEKILKQIQLNFPEGQRVFAAIWPDGVVAIFEDRKGGPFPTPSTFIRAYRIAREFATSTVLLGAA